jgi:hypothetical protein
MQPAVRFAVISSDLRFLQPSTIHPGEGLGERAASLSRALAHSPIWSRMGPACLILRPGPIPSLVALGRFDSADLARIGFLSRWLEEAVATTRYLTYDQVGEAVARLAERLRDTFGEEAREFDYVGIPRGGLIVQGMLAYAMDLDADRLERGGDDHHRPLVVVDDCALTGSRFRRFVTGSPRRNLVFAHLCSTPQLRRALVAREPTVSHAVAAIDLRDLAPEWQGDGYPEWKERVEAQAGEGRYWIGQPEAVAFPWNEPDHNFWNPETEEVEWGWRIVPPERCLKKGARSHPDGIPVRTQAAPKGDLVPADHVFFGRWDGIVQVLDERNGHTSALGEVGSHIWAGLMEGESLELIARRIASRFAVDPDRARGDAEAFLEELLARGLLARRPEIVG